MLTKKSSICFRSNNEVSSVGPDNSLESSPYMKQAAENNLIMCPIGSTCIFMTNDFVTYNLAIPR